MNEKLEFSQRLHAALKQAGAQTVSPTKLAIDFNLHHRGKPVSTQAAHKWLNGSAIPSQDKVRTLSEWLNVSPEWLRYGNADRQSKAALRKNIPPHLTLEGQLLADFQQLSEAHQIIAQEVVATLLRLDKKR